MKKSFLSLLLALLLTLGVVLPSCTATTPTPRQIPKQTTSDSEKDTPKDATEKTPSESKDLPPDGYLFAQDGALRFAFPADWVEDVTSESLSYEHPTKTSFLSLNMTEASKDEFQSMTAEQYEEFVGTSFSEDLGGEIFGVKAEHVTNPNGLDVAFFSCFVTLEGLTLKQLLYAVTIGDTSYRLLFLLEETSEEFEQTVFDSLKEVTPIEPDPNVAPRGYRFYTKNDLRFLYPADWNADTLTDPETGNEISINFGYDAAFFSEMDQALFDSTVGASLKDSGFTVGDVTIEKTQNKNGILIHRIVYPITVDGYDLSMQQQIFGFTLNRTAYAVLLTLSESDDELAQKVFDSIENLHPESTPSPSETVTYHHLNLSFSVPASFGVDESSDQVFLYRGMNSVEVSSGKKTEEFDTITFEEFEANYVPSLEQEMGVNIYNLAFGRFHTEDGLLVTSFGYCFDLYGRKFYQDVYFVTVDQTTHTVVVTSTSFEEFNQMVEQIWGSFKQISGPNYSKNS